MAKDTRRNFKMGDILHGKIKEASSMTGLTMLAYIDVLVSEDLLRLKSTLKAKPARIR